ncbi:isopeptide-forming domain-containing fimbrial protein [uncultured Methanobrevibacter sp.]|uniref:isopeptide-forming domain-containing fimbrial protein n=1 Tax=uncultured Methanobrevibacter sp. TaxID=253161 RepID=UPI0025F3AEA4|nr:isopeptide-forming domain-containing fimbrial protein [uncultured Methanobrevibacter sp.]
MVLFNAVNATCDEKEWNYTNNKDDVTVEIVSFHKPAKTVSNSTPYYHEFVEYTLTVENLGNNTYTSEFDVIDSLPVGLQFIETIKIDGADLIDETVDGQVVTWRLTNISGKSNATIVIRVKVNVLGSLTNNLTVVGPRGATGMVNCTINPVPIVDVSVNITSDKDEYFVDDVAVWTITVTNAANGTNASNIRLSELLPEEFEYIDCTVVNGTFTIKMMWLLRLFHSISLLKLCLIVLLIIMMRLNTL